MKTKRYSINEKVFVVARKNIYIFENNGYIPSEVRFFGCSGPLHAKLICKIKITKLEQLEPNDRLELIRRMELSKR